MRATIDRAGRLVIPKPMREQVGLQPGEVEVLVDGSALRIEQAGEDALQKSDGRLVIGPAGVSISDDVVRALRDAGQR